MKLDNLQTPTRRCNYRTVFSIDFWNYFIVIGHILICSVKFTNERITYHQEYQYQHFRFCENSTTSIDICESRREELIIPQSRNLLPYSSRCYCDAACLEYGDCCPDLVNLQDTRMLKDIEQRDKWTCHDFYISSFYSVSMYSMNQYRNSSASTLPFILNVYVVIFFACLLCISHLRCIWLTLVLQITEWNPLQKGVRRMCHWKSTTTPWIFRFLAMPPTLSILTSIVLNATMKT